MIDCLLGDFRFWCCGRLLHRPLLGQSLPVARHWARCEVRSGPKAHL